MCTVIIHVPECAEHATRMLAVRDEDPTRPWDAPGPWWPDEYPEVIGVRDRRANGAWLAEDSPAGRLAVILNRDVLSVPDGSLESRGGIVLASVCSGESLPQRPPHRRLQPGRSGGTAGVGHHLGWAAAAPPAA